MNEEIFLSKYPELNENGFISDLKITLLKSYLNSDISKEDNKIKDIISDYNKLKIFENREKIINEILS